MKMKKILALSVSAMMALSSIANAAFYVDGDGYAVADAIPTVSEIQSTYKANVDFDVTALTLAEAQTYYKEKLSADLPLGRGSSALSDANNDFYKVKVDVSNIGDLLNGTLDADPYPNASLRFLSATVEIPGAAMHSTTTSFTSFEGTAWTLKSTASGGWAFKWGAPNTDAAYPTAGDTLIKDFALPTAEFLVIVANGYEIDVKPAVTVVYRVELGDGSAVTTADTKLAATGDNFKLPAAAPAPTKIEASATLKENTANGYIWQIDFTKNFANLTSFTAKFEADGVEPAERAISNVATIVTALGGANATVSLNVGLDTTKTLSKATFTADDNYAETDACIINANVQ